MLLFSRKKGEEASGRGRPLARVRAGRRLRSYRLEGLPVRVNAIGTTVFRSLGKSGESDTCTRTIAQMALTFCRLHRQQ